jgi:hypothetical protein
VASKSTFVDLPSTDLELLPIASLSPSSYPSLAQTTFEADITLLPCHSSQTGPNFKPLPTAGELFGPLAPTDTDWKVETSKGFRTETQSWYAILADGSWVMFQVIFSVTGCVVAVLGWLARCEWPNAS